MHNLWDRELHARMGGVEHTILISISLTYNWFSFRKSLHFDWLSLICKELLGKFSKIRMFTHMVKLLLKNIFFVFHCDNFTYIK